MIQRKQSIFLLLAVAINALLFYLPVYTFTPDLTLPDTAIHPYLISANALLAIINGAIGVLSLISIFLYKNRNVQIRVGNLSMLLTALLAGLLFFVADTISKSMNQRVDFMIGSYLPLIEIVFLFIAVRFIKKDETLVRSADRLR